MNIRTFIDYETFGTADSKVYRNKLDGSDDNLNLI